MGSKHLKQLLNEDQEPFVLKNYIDERRFQSKRPKTQQLQLKKRKPISENSSIFCKNACFFSFHDSPDIRTSPLFAFASPAKSPIRNSNTLFVHIPSRTSALLLEAALRIQKQSKKPKTPKNTGFGFFGSIMKKLTHRKKNPKRNFNRNETNVSVKDILRWDSYNGREQNTEVIQGKEEMTVGVEEIRVSEMGFSCSCNNSRPSSAWSESNEEKSLDLDTASSRSEDSEEMEFIQNGDFCSSPFRFVLERNSSPGRCTPEFSSPTRLKKQTVKEGDGQLNYEEKEFEEEEEKEQFSPVSVLDPQFEDEDDEDRHEEEEDEEEEDGLQLERSFAVVHRARQQLLHKLRRFERLAELDPIELEKRMSEEDDEEEELYDKDDDSVLLSDSTDNGDLSVREDFCESNFFDIKSLRIPSNMKNLVLDLMAEEQGDEGNVYKRLESWKEVESNTIDMMVELDFRSERDEWKKTSAQVGEAATDIELEIFSFLVQELSDELIHSS